VIGTAEVVGSVTREQLAAFHAERYRPEQVVIAAAGSVEHDELVALARRGERDHGHWNPPVSDGAGAPALAEPRFAPRRSFLQKDTEQYHVCLGGAGIARDDERRFALRVLEGVLGGTSSSRLFQEIRERRGLAYSVFCYSNLYAGTGEVGLYVGTRPDNLPEALSVLASELERCVSDPASEQELDRSRENLKGRMALALESTGARMSRLGSSILFDMPILSIGDVVERIDAVELPALAELAGELFAPARLSLAGVGPSGDDFARACAPLEVVPEQLA
jgi:predicted Zn-dependent peptidase